jgi:hypothetical protein
VVSRNVAGRNRRRGFELIGAAASRLDRNRGENDGAFGFADDSREAGTGGTANIYTGDICGPRQRRRGIVSGRPLSLTVRGSRPVLRHDLVRLDVGPARITSHVEITGDTDPMQVGGGTASGRSMPLGGPGRVADGRRPASAAAWGVALAMVATPTARVALAVAAAFAGLVLAILGVPASAQEATNPPQSPVSQVQYWSVWADREGGTHVSRCSLTGFTLQVFAPPAPAEWTRVLPDGVASATVVVQPVGWVAEWHKNPKPQWIIPLSGRWFVETTDGHRVVMGPGDLSFGGDQAARSAGDPRRVGHRSGTVGDQPAVLMVLQLQEGADLRADGPCPVR